MTTMTVEFAFTITTAVVVAGLHIFLSHSLTIPASTNAPTVVAASTSCSASSPTHANLYLTLLVLIAGVTG